MHKTPSPEVIPGSQAILDECLGFRMELPPNFLDNPQPQPPNMLYSFVRLESAEPVFAINVERLGGRLPQGALGSEFYAAMRRSLPPGAEIERVVLPWKGHQLDVFGVRFSMGGGAVCAWSVQVPLAKEAIQISVGGPADCSAACRELLGTVLSSVQGISNWDAPSSRASSRSS